MMMISGVRIIISYSHHCLISQGKVVFWASSDFQSNYIDTEWNLNIGVFTINSVYRIYQSKITKHLIL